MRTLVLALTLLVVTPIMAGAQQAKKPDTHLGKRSDNARCPYGYDACFKYLTEKRKVDNRSASFSCTKSCR